MSNRNTEHAHLMTPNDKKKNWRTPQFPGQQKGATIEQVRRLIKRQKRSKGFFLSIANGSSDFNMDLSGDARLFLGFALIMDDNDVTTQPENMKFQINNDIIIQDVQPSFFSPDFMDDEYYYFPRPLSGTDEIKMFFQNSQAVQNIRVIIYYV